MRIKSFIIQDVRCDDIKSADRCFAVDSPHSAPNLPQTPCAWSRRRTRKLLGAPSGATPVVPKINMSLVIGDGSGHLSPAATEENSYAWLDSDFKRERQRDASVRLNEEKTSTSFSSFISQPWKKCSRSEFILKETVGVESRRNTEAATEAGLAPRTWRRPKTEQKR